MTQVPQFPLEGSVNIWSGHIEARDQRAVAPADEDRFLRAALDFAANQREPGRVFHEYHVVFFGPERKTFDPEVVGAYRMQQPFVTGCRHRGGRSKRRSQRQRLDACFDLLGVLPGTILRGGAGSS